MNVYIEHITNLISSNNERDHSTVAGGSPSSPPLFGRDKFAWNLSEPGSDKRLHYSPSVLIAMPIVVENKDFE
jgi:hypothetical protein